MTGDPGTIDSYLICATPRSGSTLLCGLLRSTGVAGRPESYFRREAMDAYANQWGVPRAVDGGIPIDAYLRAARAAERTPNGIFSARIMWGTMTELTSALASVSLDRPASQLESLTNAFGRTCFLHLRRIDVVAQAVSWARAEQTHYWHPGEEVIPGGQDPQFDRDLIGRLVDTIHAHEAAWDAWFTEQRLVPHEITYEEVAADPVGVTHAVLDFLGLELPPHQTIRVRDRPQADEINADWIARFRSGQTDS